MKLFFGLLALFWMVDLSLLILMATGFGVFLLLTIQAAASGLGLYQIRKMDLNLLFYIDAERQKGVLIVRELWDEALVLISALLLIMPGILSDILGLAGLYTPLRLAFINWAMTTDPFA